MSSDPSSRKSDDITGPCPAPSPYDSNTDDDDNDSDDVDDCGSDGGDTSPQWTISSDHVSRKSDDNTDGDASSQWSTSPSRPGG